MNSLRFPSIPRPAASARRLFALAALAAAFSVGAAEPSDGAAELRQQVLAATWPADIVRLSSAFLERYPQSEFAAEAESLRQRASATAGLLNARDSKLPRAAFRGEELPADQREVLHRAALGDRSAALDMARAYAHEGQASPRAATRYLGWMQYAAQLGDKSAAYAVAVYYRNEGEPSLSAIYQARAEALGYELPAALDHVRK